jgi:hypothetical protein
MPGVLRLLVNKKLKIFNELLFSICLKSESLCKRKISSSIAAVHLLVLIFLSHGKNLPSVL